MDNLLDASRTYRSYTESDREAIRSAAVNLFVSLEEILDLSLSFSCWLLLADHYGDTKFTWNPDQARQFMVQRLDGMSRGSGEAVHYDASGKNTLFPLSQGFALVADMCEELLSTDPPEVHRSPNDIPGYAERTLTDCEGGKER